MTHKRHAASCHSIASLPVVACPSDKTHMRVFWLGQRVGPRGRGVQSGFDLLLFRPSFCTILIETDIGFASAASAGRRPRENL